MPTLPSGTVTFLFTDIEGSTPLWEHEPDQMRLALAHHDAILRMTIAKNGGHAFKKIGDAFQAAFAFPADALAAALAAQRAFAQQPWETSDPLRVRMGLHVGPAVAEDDEYRTSHTLNRVARIMSCGHGGQILLSLEVAEMVRRDLGMDVSLRDMGVHRLKGLTHLEHLFQVVIAELPDSFPPLKTLDARPTNLPIQATALIGRERDIAAVGGMLRRDDVRLVTLTGPGGTGKTRLGLRVAAELLDAFADGVYFVALAPISDPELVASTIARTLEVKESGSQPLLERLKDYLHTKHILLLLDNFEQLLPAAPLVGELLAAAPELKVLITSRSVLHLYGEREYAVSPLALPATPLPSLERLTQYEAVRLFIERAQAVKADFAVTNANAPAVAEICVRLDGLPLAIELAAARSKLFSPQALLSRLGNRLQVLIGGAQNLPARQQTLRNTIDWSYNLLTAGEQTLFRRLGVFTGGCTLEAAEAVCNFDADLPMEVLDGLEALVDHSLLRQEEALDGEPRFVMLETIREYALERSRQYEEIQALRRQHAAYYLVLAQAMPELARRTPQVWLERLEREHDNLRAALQWTLDQRETEIGLQLCASLGDFWKHHGHFGEGLRWMDALLAQSRNLRLPVRAQVLNNAGGLAFQQSNLARARELHEQSLTLARELQDANMTAIALGGVALMVRKQGDLVRARAMYEESLALYRNLANTEAIPWSLFHLGQVLLRQGDHTQAQAIGDESLLGFRKAEDFLGIAHVLGLLGEVASLRGDYERAGALLRESLTLARDLGAFLSIALGLVRLAGGDTAQERPEPVARLFGAAEALLGSLGIRMTSAERAEWDRNVSALCGHLDKAAFAAAWAEGQAMTLEQAVAEALAPTTERALGRSNLLPTPTPVSAPSHPAGLTEREVEILRLVAQGLTDAQVAERLVISPRTVQGHLRSIYGKLDVTSRTAATRFAIGHGLL